MKLLSIYVGQPKDIQYNGKSVRTGIFKKRVNKPVFVSNLNIEGDGQADLKVHGGINKAVYAYPAEHYDYWKKERPDLRFENGAFGENLSITGLMEKDVYIGNTYSVGEAELAITMPRMPCFKLGIKMGDPLFVEQFIEANKSGFYFRVDKEGMIKEGEDINLIYADNDLLSISQVFNLYAGKQRDKRLLEKAVNSTSLPADWKDHFRKFI